MSSGWTEASLALPVFGKAPFSASRSVVSTALAVDLGEVMAQVGLFLRRRGEAVAPGQHRVAHELVGKHHGHPARRGPLQAFQGRSRPLPGLGAEGGIARNRFFPHDDFRGEKTNDQGLRKQT
jgi:hypothetical protein